MCTFSRSVKVVSDTSIFARSVEGRQFLVYGMTYAAGSELAMVLPLPVPQRARGGHPVHQSGRIPDAFQRHAQRFPADSDAILLVDPIALRQRAEIAGPRCREL